MDRFSKGSRKTLNLIIFALFVLTMWFNISYYHANPAKVGEFLGYTAMITVAVWFLSLLIPKKYVLYRIMSSGTFILLIPLFCSFVFTWELVKEFYAT